VAGAKKDSNKDSYNFTNEQNDYESLEEESISSIEKANYLKPEAVLAEDKELGAYSEYYLKVTNIIYDYFSKNYLNMGLNREVNVVFLLSNRGELIGKPAVTGEVDPIVRDLAIEVIKKAGPYPVFPGSFEKDKEAFNILLNF